MPELLEVLTPLLLIVQIVALSMIGWNLKVGNRRDNSWLEYVMRRDSEADARRSARLKKGSKGEELPTLNDDGTLKQDFDAGVSSDARLLAAKYDEERKKRAQMLAKDEWKMVE